MKKNLFIALLLTSSAAFAQTNKEPYMTQSLSGIKSVEVQTTGGNVAVTGGSESKIEVYVTPNNMKLGNSMSKEEIKSRLDELYTLEITTEGGKLVAKAKQKERNMDWKRALNISFKIWVPKDVTTNLSTSGGNIELENLNGDQDFRTSGGNLKLKDLSGKVKGRTSGGNVHMKGLRDQIDLSTSGGNIEADNSEGNMKLSTSGGNVHLSDLKGTIKANTSGGNVKADDIRGDLSAHTSGGNVILKDMKGSIDASTSGGSIRVEIKELGKFVKLDNSGGNIEVELPSGKGLDLNLKGHKVHTDNLTNFNGSKDDDSIKGTINGGGVEINVNAGSGKVSLSLK